MWVRAAYKSQGGAGPGGDMRRDLNSLAQERAHRISMGQPASQPGINQAQGHVRYVSAWYAWKNNVYAQGQCEHGSRFTIYHIPPQQTVHRTGHRVSTAQKSNSVGAVPDSLRESISHQITKLKAKFKCFKCLSLFSSLSLSLFLSLFPSLFPSLF